MLVMSWESKSFLQPLSPIPFHLTFSHLQMLAKNHIEFYQYLFPGFKSQMENLCFWPFVYFPLSFVHFAGILQEYVHSTWSV